MVVGSLTVETDVVVIGSGPGGYVAAIRAAQLGKDVIVVEKAKEIGGVCLHWGCIPTKALITASNYFNELKDLFTMGVKVDTYSLDMGVMMDWSRGIITKMESGIKMLFEKYGIEVVEGTGSFTDKNTLRVSGQSDVNTITFKHAIIATGSRPIEIPGIEFDGEKIISSKEALQLKDVPKKLIIIGGGYIGTEMATVYGKLGSEVHILEGKDHLIPILDKDIVDVTAQTISKYNVTIHYTVQANSVEKTDTGVVVHMTKEGKDETIDGDTVMVVVGRRPNSTDLGLEHIDITPDDHGFIPVNEQLQTSVPHIYAIGDVQGQPMLAHKAMRQGKVAAEVLSGEASAYDNKVVPSVVFNDPELISVGWTEEEAQEKGYETYSKKFPYAALARSHFTDRTKGFIKMVADKKTNILLGVHGVGPHVSEILSEATLAIEMGATVEDVAFTIHPHPTISESMGEVADMMIGSGVHIYEEPQKKE